MTKRSNVLWFGKELPGVCTRETYRNVSVVERGKSIVFIIQELGTLNCQVTDPVQTKAAFYFLIFSFSPNQSGELHHQSHCQYHGLA